MFANANRDPKKTEPWHPFDFMPGGNRELRLAKERVNRDIAVLDQWGMQVKLSKKDVEIAPEDVGLPDWAVGPYKGKP